MSGCKLPSSEAAGEILAAMVGRPERPQVKLSLSNIDLGKGTGDALAAVLDGMDDDFSPLTALEIDNTSLGPAGVIAVLNGLRFVPTLRQLGFGRLVKPKSKYREAIDALADFVRDVPIGTRVPLVARACFTGKGGGKG